MTPIIPEVAPGERKADDLQEQGSGGAPMTTQIVAEHRKLNALFDDVREAFSDPDARVAAREAFTELRQALETHFDQEERLYYPAIWGLRPDKKVRLRACIDTHSDFRTRMRAIHEQLALGDVGHGARSFEKLATAFLEHEALEEQVLAELEREIAANG